VGSKANKYNAIDKEAKRIAEECNLKRERVQKVLHCFRQYRNTELGN